MTDSKRQSENVREREREREREWEKERERERKREKERERDNMIFSIRLNSTQSPYIPEKSPSSSSPHLSLWISYRNNCITHYIHAQNLYTQGIPNVVILSYGIYDLISGLINFCFCYWWGFCRKLLRVFFREKADNYVDREEVIE